jgi:NADH-quinone oxidoreductase subunit L
VLGAAMALKQKDLKKMLTYTAISLSGLVAVGFGTGTDAGVSGALYAMINTVFCICGLFILCGIIEKKTETTDLEKLKGIGRIMPAAAVCFGILSLSALGFPLFGGFFAGQLILGAVLEASVVFYICVFIGIFLMTLNFIRAGRTLICGECELEIAEVKKGHVILIPVYVLSGLTMLLCYNPLLLDGMIKPALNTSDSYAGFPASVVSMIVTVLVLLLAAADHIFGYKKTGNALDSYNHISDVP